MGVSAFHKSLWPQIIRRYAAGEEMNAIAEDLGVDRKTVYNVARRAGLPNRHKFDPARTARILKAYEAGTPVHEIARTENVHRTFVGNVARKAGLPPQANSRRRYPLNEHAFDNPTPVGWWLIGLLAADGSVTTGNLISLSQRTSDSDVLWAFFEYVGCPSRPLTHLKLSPEAAQRAWPRSPACEARIWSRHIKEVLASHGVTATKTRSLRFGQEAAAKAAVWLGLLDGDGWVSKMTKRGRPEIAFFGTAAVMRQCSNFWGARLDFQRAAAPTVNKHRGGLGAVRLYGANAVRAAEILLAASPTSLQRKRRTLEAIAATAGTLNGSAPRRMRTSTNSN